jgi:hypothetical protein
MYSFDITDDEMKQMDQWEKQHELECPIILNYKMQDYETPETCSPYGAIGGGRTYSFTPTSIGMLISIKCCCGAKFNCDSNL